MCGITACAAIETYRSDIEVQLIKTSNMYGMAIVRKIDKAFICGWKPFTYDLEELKGHLRGVLSIALKYGSITYHQEGTFLFERYNMDDEVLSPDVDVLTEEKIEHICETLSAREKDAGDFQSDYTSFFNERW